MSTLNRCKYCIKQVVDNDSEVYICDKCSQYAHLACMNCDRLPRLKGDRLFIYECRHCAYEKRDTLTRMKLSWVQVIHLALYNLMVSTAGKQGFFRWKEDICEYIEKNWVYLMPDREKTATWGGTIAGVLSVHSKLFRSGSHIFNENGWWSLQEVKPPNPNSENYKMYKTTPQFQMCLSKKTENPNSTDYGRGKRQRKGKKKDDNTSKNENEKATDHINGHDYISSEQKHVLGEPVVVKVEENYNFMEKDTKENIPSNSNLEIYKTVVVKTEPQFGDYENDISNLFDTSEHPFLGENINLSSDDNPFCLPFLPEDMSDYNPTLFNDADFNDLNEVEDEICKINAVGQKETSENVVEEEAKGITPLNNIVPLTAKEELELLSKINECVNVLDADLCVRRLRRKLLVRKAKRQTHQKLFSLKETCEGFAAKDAPKNVRMKNDVLENEDTCDNASSRVVDSSKNTYNHPALCNVHVLDRFFCFHHIEETNHNKSSVHVRLVGNSDESICYRSIVSPYTSRVLKPYIRRDFHILPCKLKILRDIQKRNSNGHNQRTYPIDYCYVQPTHVPAVNALCSDFFWPGIDMTECLQYPEFSCIVLYRKLVIGFAFMVPDVKYNEAYISFILVHPDWQRAGIGSNMVYHLIQTCMGKDITLHVSPNNSSILLYQKFGFKSEKLILDFYDKYLPESSKACRHALLLRLRR